MTRGPVLAATIVLAGAGGCGSHAPRAPQAGRGATTVSCHLRTGATATLHLPAGFRPHRPGYNTACEWRRRGYGYVGVRPEGLPLRFMVRDDRRRIRNGVRGITGMTYVADRPVFGTAVGEQYTRHHGRAYTLRPFDAYDARAGGVRIWQRTLSPSAVDFERLVASVRLACDPGQVCD